jgi:hypothetical protein
MIDVHSHRSPVRNPVKELSKTMQMSSKMFTRFDTAILFDTQSILFINLSLNLGFVVNFGR